MKVTANPLNDDIVLHTDNYYEWSIALDILNDIVNTNSIKINESSHYFIGGETEHIKSGQKIDFHHHNYVLSIEKIIANDDAVIVFFVDKTKTIVKRMPGDDDDIYAAVAQAICKKIYGGTSSFHKMVDKKLEDYRKE